ncbi:MAG: RNA methyltransferase, partial [Erysipelotrichaceae bacterium]
MIFEGAIAVKAILEANKREVKWVMVDVKKDDRNTRYILNLAKKQNIEVIYTAREEIDELASGKTHGGIIIEASKRKNDQLIHLNLKENSTIFLIEGVEDPFNLGYALRSLYAFGCDGVLIKNQHLIHSESIIVKSSAGASEKLPMIVVDDFNDSLHWLKKKDFKLVSMQRNDDSLAYDQYPFNQRLVIAIGGEKRGLSKEILDQQDQMIYIPYMSDFKNALNMTSALITIASEVARQ